MPAFTNPYAGNIPKIMNPDELFQSIRVAFASELEAIFIYDAIAKATTDELAQAVTSDIRNEEIAHTGELLTLMFYLHPDEAEHVISGEGEVHAMMQKLGLTAESLVSNSKLTKRISEGESRLDKLVSSIRETK